MECDTIWIEWSSSTTISQTWLPCIQSCSYGCVWEWLNGWIDYSDLPILQSIQLATGALLGDYSEDRKTIITEPYNYKNTLTMRSEIEWVDEWIDLPSLTEFKGDRFNFKNIGSVILESMDLVFDWCRYPSINIWWNQLRYGLLLLHLYHSAFTYSFSHFLISRCWCSRFSHQKQKQLRLLTENVSYQHNKWQCDNDYPNKHGIDLIVETRRWKEKKRYEWDV